MVVNREARKSLMLGSLKREALLRLHRVHLSPEEQQQRGCVDRTEVAAAAL
jgi:hypothetical protein